MKVATTIAEARTWRQAISGRVGLVPTMGALHAGHLSLLARARAECDQVAASVFVNPTQFGPQEDLSRYPRDLARDQALLTEGGCDLVFAPPAQEMYPDGFETWVVPGDVSTPLEGERRPGHFRGVATVVLKLFHTLLPHFSYFGRKDAQQLAVIRRMVLDLDVPVEVVACETVREPDGLALSSRNVYLSPEERRAAPVLYRALRAAHEGFGGGERSAETLRQAMHQVVTREALARIDYVSVADAASLRELERVDFEAVASLAVYFGRTRLIDNLALTP